MKEKKNSERRLAGKDQDQQNIRQSVSQSHLRMQLRRHPESIRVSFLSSQLGCKSDNCAKLQITAEKLGAGWRSLEMNAAEHLETLFKETSAGVCAETTFPHYPGVLNDLCVTELAIWRKAEEEITAFLLNKHSLTVKYAALSSVICILIRNIVLLNGCGMTKRSNRTDEQATKRAKALSSAHSASPSSPHVTIYHWREPASCSRYR